jgi:hypothetical protein
MSIRPIALLAAITVPVSAAAQDAAETIPPTEPAPEAAVEESEDEEEEAPASPGKKLDVDLHGFAEVIARGDLSAGTFDISLQQAEFDVIGNWNDRVFFRTDFQYDAYYFDASTPVGFLGSFVEQANVDVQFYDKAALRFGGGRFAAPFGFEALDPVDRPIGSYSQVFNYMDPFLFTGLRFSGAYEWFDFVVYLSQGYEVIVDNNTDKTVGWRLGFKPGAAAYLGFAGTYGSENVGNVDPRLNLSIDYTITPTDKLLLGGELTFRNQMGADSGMDDDTRALGFLFEGAYRFHEYFGLAFRGDTIQDFDGIIFGTGDALSTYSWTLAPTVHVLGHARIQLEYKGYAASQNIFFTDRSALDAPTTSPTASQLFQAIPADFAATNGASTGHTLTLHLLGSF